MLNTKFSPFKSSSTEIIEEQNRLEASLNLSDANFDKVLSLTGDVAVSFCEVTAGEIRYGGRITFNVIYESNGVERLEAGAEFSYKRIGTFDGGSATAKLTLAGVNLKRSGGMLYAEAIVNATIEYEKNNEVDCLTDVDVFKKQETLLCPTLISAEHAFELDDEFSCPKISKMLCSDAKAVISHAETADGVVICDGEVVLTLVMLPFMQNNDIVKEKRIIPFRLEVELDGATPNLACYANVDVKKINVKVFIDDESSESSISTTVEIKLSATAQKYNEIQAVTDAYSCDNELAIKRFDTVCECVSGYAVESQKASGKFVCDIPENSRFICIIGENLEVTNVYCENQEIKADLLIFGDAIFMDSDGQTISRRAEMPCSIHADMGSESYANVQVVLENVSTKLRSGQIEAESQLRFCFVQKRKKTVSGICLIEEGEQIEKNHSAISVYLAKKGDTEWELVKELGVGIDEIFQTNPTIEFPLQGGESIVCYRQKKV